MDMMNELSNIQQATLLAVKDATSASQLEEVRVAVLGRKGTLTVLLKGLKDLEETERREMGQRANIVRDEIELMFVKREEELRENEFGQLAEKEWLDVTAPGIPWALGGLHLVTQTINRIVEIFHGIGFARVSAPEIEWDHYAFEALNMPADHPARDDWETFFIDAPLDAKWGRQLLTPHTSNVQVRMMEHNKPPIKIMNLSRVYRRQSDMSHVPMFHQFEGLCVSETTTIADLKGTIEYVLKEFFGEERKIRYRPYHFRFTEPSFEIDINCDVCNGKGNCRLCKEGWLELAGAGLTHPYVLEASGIDPKTYSGFAFGFGVERIAMMRGGVSISDMRMLYQNDVRFLRQF